MVVVLAFYGGNAISGNTYTNFGPQSHNIYSGFKNPTLALQLLVWNLNYNFESLWVYPLINQKNVNVFQYGRLGSYFWIYFTAPIIAGIFAGLIAKFHFQIFDKELSRSAMNSKMSIQDDDICKEMADGWD